MKRGFIDKTHDDLRSFLRVEVRSKRLKKLDPGFYDNIHKVLSYLEKQAENLLEKKDITNYINIKERIDYIERDFKALFQRRFEKLSTLSLYDVDREILSILTDEEIEYLQTVSEINAITYDFLLKGGYFDHTQIDFNTEENDEELQLLRVKFEYRFLTLTQRSEKYGVKVPDKEALWTKILKSFENGFTCEYCDSPLKISEPDPHPNIFSIDHRTPLILHGTSDLDNIAIVCYRCNILKGSSTEDSWKSVLSSISDKSVLEPMYSDRLQGIVNAQERVKKAN